MSDIIRIFSPIAIIAAASSIIIIRLGLPSWMVPLPFVLMVGAMAWKGNKEITKTLLLAGAVTAAIVLPVLFLFGLFP